MPIKTAEEYVESLRRLRPTVYILGERVRNVVDHPLIRPSINSVAATYELAHHPEYEDLMTATSHLTGERVSRFTHIFRSTEDLVKKVKMIRLCAQKVGTCFVRCLGLDALNTLSIITYEIDRKRGTNYAERFNKYLRYVQENDLTCHAAMTDVKGDRSKRPSQQADPDLYLHVVERRDDGIVVRGAKMHQTGAACSHEAIILPTTRMTEEDKAYAVAFAVPTDAEGIIYVYGRAPMDTRELEGVDIGNVRYGKHGMLMIFNDVFVPWERVFLCEEYEFVVPLVETFAAYHRQSHGACKPGMADVLIGAASLAAKYNGVAGASHIRDKLTEMVHLCETIYAGAIASGVEGSKTPSGTYLVNILLANVAKHNVSRLIPEIYRLAQDIAGGLVVNLPSEKDYRHAEIGKYIEKYLKGVPEVPTEHRMRIFRLIESMTLGIEALSVIHGAGSPATHRIGIRRHANLEEREKLAKVIAGIEG